MIEFFHVTKWYDERYTALNDVTLFIDKGDFVFLTGASGAGKTTLLKHIYMEEKPTTGSVFVCGFQSKYIQRKEIPLLRRKLGIVFQDFRLLTDRNVFENIAFAIRVTGTKEIKVKRKVFEVLAKTGLSHKCTHMPNQLSGGEQQRLCIARAIANDPLILLADEPTGNLDYEIALEIFELLKKINSWGTTIIMATHDLYLLSKYHYRQITLDRGHLISSYATMIKQKFWFHQSS
ncbi:MAG: cell division ATP-binding protein FtsE [Chitinivibrionales bacterium]|nr:cell division ATP-binding protein FtsE [Chitinivibrionales bacterium]